MFGLEYRMRRSNKAAPVEAPIARWSHTRHSRRRVTEQRRPANAMNLPTILTLMIACVVLSSCKPPSAPVGVHQFNTVTFDLTSPPPASTNRIPNIWLDTNMEVDGLFGGGKVKSSKPYHIRIDYTDNSDSFETLEITKVKVVYDDGKVEAAANELTFPIRIRAREYEVVNSIAGGRIVKTKVNLLSGTLRDVITRDESLTLVLEGLFTTKTGVQHPYMIDYHYTVRFDKGSRLLEDR